MATQIHAIGWRTELGYQRMICTGCQMDWPCHDVANAEERVVWVQGHRHSEPICAWPDCQTYLTLTEMANLPDLARSGQ